jgi:hypothetical protein
VACVGTNLGLWKEVPRMVGMKGLNASPCVSYFIDFGFSSLLQPKLLVASKYYEVVLIRNIRENVMA